ncbi:hypothetical protein [Nocardia sp. NPDC051570]|uniref:hypothetical protein n=1 Tax=Nocardia sp. NPDC051570 TaxID=3364324 RepID=UPI0037929CE5
MNARMVLARVEVTGTAEHVAEVLAQMVEAGFTVHITRAREMDFYGVTAAFTAASVTTVAGLSDEELS